jgi:hypothetical protein
MKTIRVEMLEDGKLIVDHSGFLGGECMDDLEAIVRDLKQLGIEVRILKQQKKGEFYARTGNHIRRR